MTRILLNFILVIVLYMIYRKVPQRFALISFFLITAVAVLTLILVGQLMAHFMG